MPPVPRRGFLTGIGAISSLLGLSVFARPADGDTLEVTDPWMAKVTGKHRVVFHSHEPTQGQAIRWAQTFLDTQKVAYGIRDDANTVIVGLNGKAIAWCFGDALWSKYATIGEVVQAPGNRNPQAAAIASLQARGVLFLACNNSIRAAGPRFLPEAQRGSVEARDAFADEVRRSLLPGVEVVPSMVVTLQQAQDRGCRYIYAGG